MNDLLKKIMSIWTGLSSARRSAAVVMLFCIISSSFFFYRWATKIEYAPLFTHLQANNAGVIVERLKAMGVPYSLSDGGQTILVPQDQVYDLRLKLASEGVFTGGGIGFELFDESRLGSTEFERHVNYLRALQEELRRTIVQLDAVEQARVHLVLPEQSVFIKDQGRATASIAVKLKPMASLGTDQVRGIIQLVAHSVENLRPEDVTIIDMDGHILNENLQENGQSSASVQQARQLELKREFERNLEKRVNYLLERMYGSGNVVTMVTADLDFNQKEVTRIEWGDEGVVRSEQIIQEENINAPNNNDVGEENREFTTFPTQEEVIQNAGTHKESITNYEINKTEEKIVYAPGRILSLSASVAVDGILSQEEEDRIKEIVASAIGYNEERNDKITVVSLDFDKTRMEEIKEEMARAAAEASRKEKLNNLISWGLKALGLLLAFILILVLIRSLQSILSGAGTPSIQRPTPIRQVEEELEEPIVKSKSKAQQEKAAKVVEEHPESTAQIITSWLSED